MNYNRGSIVFVLSHVLPLLSDAFPWLHSPHRRQLVHDSVEVKLLEEKYDTLHQLSDTSRTRRSADTMPSDLHFQLRFGSRDVHLRMRRSPLGLNKDGKKNLPDFPVFVIENGRIKRKQLLHDPGVGLYANETTGSSFVVRKTSNRTDFILEGIFYDGLDQLQLTRDATGGLHQIHKQTREVDFRNDYIEIFNNEVARKSTRESRRPVPGRKVRSRGKRHIGSGTEHEIQLFMVADNRDYRTWLKYYNYNSTLTELEMNLYYAFVANSISVRYSSIPLVDPSFTLNAIVTGLLIVNSQEISYWTENNTLRPGSHYVDASGALESFRHWVKANRFELPPSDHWMLFTGFDIFTDRNPNVAGLAKLGGMCSLSSISIIEQDNTGSVGATAAHELGHSLSALHDGEEKDCFDEDNYIMSRKLKTPDDERLASRPWQFSPCSVRAFKKFVSEIKCTQKSAMGMSVLSTSLSPGQVFSADLQCQLALGNGSYFGRSLQIREGYPSLCRRMFCAVPDEPGLYQAIFAMEKTSCGNGKWCQKGQCVEDVSAPRMEDSCPQGDDPTAPCVREDCPYYTSRTKVVYCCHTCRDTPPSWIELVTNRATEPQVVRRIEASPAAQRPASILRNNTATPSAAPAPASANNHDAAAATASVSGSATTTTTTATSTSATPVLPVPPDLPSISEALSYATTTTTGAAGPVSSAVTTAPTTATAAAATTNVPSSSTTSTTTPTAAGPVSEYSDGKERRSGDIQSQSVGNFDINITTAPTTPTTTSTTTTTTTATTSGSTGITPVLHGSDSEQRPDYNIFQSVVQSNSKFVSATSSTTGPISITTTTKSTPSTAMEQFPGSASSTTHDLSASTTLSPRSTTSLSTTRKPDTISSTTTTTTTSSSSTTTSTTTTTSSTATTRSTDAATTTSPFKSDSDGTGKHTTVSLYNILAITTSAKSGSDVTVPTAAPTHYTSAKAAATTTATTVSASPVWLNLNVRKGQDTTPAMTEEISTWNQTQEPGLFHSSDINKTSTTVSPQPNNTKAKDAEITSLINTHEDHSKAFLENQYVVTLPLSDENATTDDGAALGVSRTGNQTHTSDNLQSSVQDVVLAQSVSTLQENWNRSDQNTGTGDKTFDVNMGSGMSFDVPHNENIDIATNAAINDSFILSQKNTTNVPILNIGTNRTEKLLVDTVEGNTKTVLYTELKSNSNTSTETLQLPPTSTVANNLKTFPSSTMNSLPMSTQSTINGKLSPEHLGHPHSRSPVLSSETSTVGTIVSTSTPSSDLQLQSSSSPLGSELEEATTAQVASFQALPVFENVRVDPLKHAPELPKVNHLDFSLQENVGSHNFDLLDLQSGGSNSNAHNMNHPNSESLKTNTVGDFGDISHRDRLNIVHDVHHHENTISSLPSSEHHEHQDNSIPHISTSQLQPVLIPREGAGLMNRAGATNAGHFELSDISGMVSSDLTRMAFNADQLLNKLISRTDLGASSNSQQPVWGHHGNAPSVLDNGSYLNLRTGTADDYVIDYVLRHDVTGYHGNDYNNDGDHRNNENNNNNQREGGESGNNNQLRRSNNTSNNDQDNGRSLGVAGTGNINNDRRSSDGVSLYDQETLPIMVNPDIPTPPPAIIVPYRPPLTEFYSDLASAASASLSQSSSSSSSSFLSPSSVSAPAAVSATGEVLRRPPRCRFQCLYFWEPTEFGQGLNFLQEMLRAYRRETENRSTSGAESGIPPPETSRTSTSASDLGAFHWLNSWLQHTRNERSDSDQRVTNTRKDLTERILQLPP